MDINARIHEYVRGHREEMAAALSKLVKIPSVSDSPAAGEALFAVKKLYEENGFETGLCDGYLLAFCGEGTHSIGLFSHADVVPAADDWIYARPFDPIMKDGCLIGRGAADDKAGIIISLYCAKMIKELKLPFRSRLVMFTGSSEETGMSDIENYAKEQVPPDISFVPDADFPPFRGDKGILHFYAVSRRLLSSIAEFSGGEVFNIILGAARVRIRGDAAFSSLSSVKSENISVTLEGGDTIIEAAGLSRHAAFPDGSRNAAAMIADLLSNCAALPDGDRAEFETARRLLSNDYGEQFGVACDDPDFGRLTAANGMVSLRDGRLCLSFDVRFGLAAADGLEQKISAALSALGWDFELSDIAAPFALPSDHPMVKAAGKAYRDFTGEDAVIGIDPGGTYARYLPAAIETGVSLGERKMPEMPEGHGGIHQPDECIDIDGFAAAAELTLRMILACDEEGIS